MGGKMPVKFQMAPLQLIKIIIWGSRIFALFVMGETPVIG
jgi:hypothetical protein